MKRQHYKRRNDIERPRRLSKWDSMQETPVPDYGETSAPKYTDYETPQPTGTTGRGPESQVTSGAYGNTQVLFSSFIAIAATFWFII